MKHKHLSIFKRSVSAILSVSVLAGFANVFVASGAEEKLQSQYPYVIFAENTENGIDVNCESLTLNGDGFTNGTYNLISDSGNINGAIISPTEEAEIETEEIIETPLNSSMIYLHSKLINRYFSENCQTYTEGKKLADMNVNVNAPIYVKGALEIDGNAGLNASIGAVTDITVTGETLNSNNTAIYSKFGNITINCSEISVNGIIYAPFGTVNIDCTNFNINGIIIAQNVIINGLTVNVNYSTEVAQFVGTRSEAIRWSYEDFKYLDDTDGDYLPDPIEKAFSSDPLLTDTDGDTLPDGYEVIVFHTSPVKVDTNNNGINDDEEDFDSDGLSNAQEYQRNTHPFISDTDGDTLIDGDEVTVYLTDPLLMDTDGDGLDDPDEIYFNTDPNDADSNDNGISDGDEKRAQILVHEAENKESAVTEVTVAFEGTGNINRNTEIMSVMDKDVLCSEVVGLVGEPFSIETTSKFDKATLTFTIDKSKLGDTSFEDLLFLWHDEEKHSFEELETFYDEENGKVYIETTHFSRYMVVDSKKWFKAWAIDLNYNPGSHYPISPLRRYNTVLAIDCSGSMYTNDPFTVDHEGRYSICERKNAAEGFINNMSSVDKAAIVLFDDYATLAQSLTSDKARLRSALDSISSDGGTNFTAAITRSVSELSTANITSNSVDKRIILLSDGVASISNSVLDQAKNKNIVIHTVGLGPDSNDALLQRIADYTGGTFYKAFKADELVEIYTEFGFNEDFDTTDTDGDGLYDAVEAAGIRLENGRIIKECDPTLKDTDGDGIDDGIEIWTEIQVKDAQQYPSYVPEEDRKKQYYFVMLSNPTKTDSDNDGLPDGYWDRFDPNKPIYGKGVYRDENEEEIIAPFDIEPLRYNGAKGMWKKHIENAKNGSAPHKHKEWYGLEESFEYIEDNYDSFGAVDDIVDAVNDFTNFGAEGVSIVLPALLTALCIEHPELLDMIGDKLAETFEDFSIFDLNIDDLSTDYILEKIADMSVLQIYDDAVSWIASSPDISESEAKDITAALGAAILNFKADRRGVVHSQMYQWQDIGGFNEFYDEVFGWATDMNRAKFNFTVGGTEYIFWLWHGNYINLGAGCEIGIYKRPASMQNDIDHYFCDIDLALPMNLYLYNYYDSDNITNVLSWEPDIEQWWITGFNPEYAGNVDYDAQIVVGSVDLSGNKSYFNEMYANYRDNDRVYFDQGSYTIFFMWK